jgi:hypothetical protein
LSILATTKILATTEIFVHDGASWAPTDHDPEPRYAASSEVTDRESYDDIRAILHVEELHAAGGVFVKVLVLTLSDTLKVLPRANFRKLAEQERLPRQLRQVIGDSTYEKTVQKDSQRVDDEKPFLVYLSTTEMLNDLGELGLNDGEERPLRECSLALRAYAASCIC